MTEWGVRLEIPGGDPEVVKVPTGKDGAEAYAAFIKGSVSGLVLGEKATVVTRAAGGQPWKVPSDD